MVIEMQQWDKPDIVQRFFLYFCLTCGLQLKDLPKKYIKIKEQVKEIRDYRRVEPTKTLIWLVDTNFKFVQNFMSYSMYPDNIADFIRDDELWNIENHPALIKVREELLQIVDNKIHSLNFLQTNKLIFMFQENIVKSEKITRYKRWFDFAAKTRKPENKSTDFSPYEDNIIFAEIMKRLQIKFFSEEDLKYMELTTEIQKGLESYDDGIYSYGFIDGQQQGIKKEKEYSRKIIKQAEDRTKQAEQEKKQAEIEKLVLKLFYKKQKNIEEISIITKQSIEIIKKILDAD